MDRKGEYARKWLPALKNFPDKYIYDPSSAPLEAQKVSSILVLFFILFKFKAWE
jgi:deoxyribodipyrimidine photolyase